MQLISGRRFQHSYLAQFMITPAGWKFFATISMFTSHHTLLSPPIICGWLIGLQQTWGLIFTIKVGSLGL